MIIIIAAMTKKKHIIGKGNGLPWRIPDEIKHFRELTKDSVVIVGRNTFFSIGKPLPKRINIVVSHLKESIPGVEVASSLENALDIAHQYDKPIFIIGGASIYKQALPFADKLYLSFIKKEYKGDIVFPDFNTSQWNVEEVQDFPEFEFVIYSRE